MASWNDIFSQIQSSSPIDDICAKSIKMLSDYRNRNVICYYSGWLQGRASSETSILDNDINGLMNAMYHLDKE